MDHLPQFIWHICDAYLPELQFRLRNPGKAPVRSKLPAALENRIKLSGWVKAYNDWFTETHSTDKSVLVLPIEGEMSRGGGWYGYGNDFLIRQLNAAATDTDYKGAVLKANTPGGTADSTPAFAEAVANFRKVKPVVTHTAYCASAGYYVASQSDEIIMEDQAASQIGSIGTLLIYENYKKYLEQEGIDIQIMRAKGSEDKARVNWIEELTPEARAGLQAMLDACQKEFAGAVKRGRAGKITSNEVLTGKMYGVNDALKLGLIDAKGDLASAVKRVITLSGK
ncbi:S49 family peptidase [Dyadobacter sp. 32]|uniref:S49 family peptidase n=1 Tax=Dyadobacter sp. 32 TaxID=538966 RepID=UPI0011EF0F4F